MLIQMFVNNSDLYMYDCLCFQFYVNTAGIIHNPFFLNKCYAVVFGVQACVFLF